MNACFLIKKSFVSKFIEIQATYIFADLAILVLKLYCHYVNYHIWCRINEIWYHKILIGRHMLWVGCILYHLFTRFLRIHCDVPLFYQIQDQRQFCWKSWYVWNEWTCCANLWNATLMFQRIVVLKENWLLRLFQEK